MPRSRIQLLLCECAACLATAVAVGQQPEVRFESARDSLQITIGGKPFARYVFRDPQISRPYFTQVHAPSGSQVTRNHPPVQGQDLVDHPSFHPGIWLAFGDLGGGDFWRNRAQVEHVKFTETPVGRPGHGRFAVLNRYRTDRTICKESCQIALDVLPAGYLLTWSSSFQAVGGELVFGDQEEMGLGVRLATPLIAKHGGQIFNSAGQTNEAGAWGKQADWCAYGGRMEGISTGIVLMPDPANFGKSWFHARDYGLLVANPFGRQAFTKGEQSRVIVSENKPLTLRFGVLIYGEPNDRPPDIKAAYQAFLKRQSQGG